MKVIYASKGLPNYMGGTITERFNEDITGTGFTVALVPVSSDPPAADSDEWVTPHVNVQGATTANRVLKYLVSAVPGGGPGEYKLLAQVDDDPEKEAVVLQKATIL